MEQVKIHVSWIVFLLLCLSMNVYSQILIKETHKINIDILQYHAKLQKARIATYSPLKKVKLTLKAGFNNSILSKIDIESLEAGDTEDAFADVEAEDIATIVKYDARAKIYLSKRWRFLMRSQLNGSNKNIYTIGFFWKV